MVQQRYTTAFVLIERICVGLLFALSAVALAFAWSYDSYSPAVGRFSTAYVVGVITPLGLCSVAVLALMWRPVQRLMAGRRPPRFLVASASVLVLVATIVFSSLVPESRAAITALFLVPTLWITVLARICQKNELFLTAAICGLMGLVFVVAELPPLLRPPLVRWGDEDTVAYMFPRQPPFVGPGGRLRPRQDRLLHAPDRPSGVRLITNSDGFRNSQDFAPAPSSGVTRILSLGDSFSTGYGMDQGEFFGALLERGLNEALHLVESGPASVEVLNAEVSDPAHGLYYLQHFGIGFHPQIVVYGLCGNDLAQVASFYGPGRRFVLTAEGVLEANENYAPKLDIGVLREHQGFVYPRVSRCLQTTRWSLGTVWSGLQRHFSSLCLFRRLRNLTHDGLARPSPMYSFMHVVEASDGRKRLLDGYADLGFFYPAGSHVVEPMWERFFEILQAMDRTARKKGAVFVLVIFPQRFQVQPRDWQVICDHAGLVSRDFDLDLPERRILDSCRQHGIPCLDLLEPMRQAAATKDLYLPAGDMHFNQVGTRIAATQVSDFILKNLSVVRPPSTSSP